MPVIAENNGARIPMSCGQWANLDKAGWTLVSSDCGSEYTLDFLAPYASYPISGKDNWGTQVVVSNDTIDGDGTAANPLRMGQNGATGGGILVWNAVTGTWVAQSHWVLEPDGRISRAGSDITVQGITVGTGGAISNPANLALGAGALAVAAGVGSGTSGTGTSNLAIGDRSLNETTTGNTNVAVGALALRRNVSGGSNVAVGFNAVRDTVGGSQNTGIGFNVLLLGNALNNNTAVGFEAGRATTGARNLYIGHRAGRSYTSAIDSVVIGGFEGGTGWINGAGRIMISDGAGNPRIKISNAGRVRIGDTTLTEATSTLHVVGDFLLTTRTGTPAKMAVFTSAGILAEADLPSTAADGNGIYTGSGSIPSAGSTVTVTNAPLTIHQTTAPNNIAPALVIRSGQSDDELQGIDFQTRAGVKVATICQFNGTQLYINSVFAIVMSGTSTVLIGSTIVTITAGAAGAKNWNFLPNGRIKFPQLTAQPTPANEQGLYFQKEGSPTNGVVHRFKYRGDSEFVSGIGIVWPAEETVATLKDVTGNATSIARVTGVSYAFNGSERFIYYSRGITATPNNLDLSLFQNTGTGITITNYSGFSVTTTVAFWVGKTTSTSTISNNDRITLCYDGVEWYRAT